MSKNMENDATKSEEQSNNSTSLSGHIPVQSVDDGFGDPGETLATNVPSEYTTQKPILVLTGTSRSRYFVHRGLFAAKSPYFRVLLKSCWSGEKDEIEIPDIPSDGFNVVVDWMYSGQLPDKVKVYTKGNSSNAFQIALNTYKAADVLMITQLQNAIIENEAAIFAEHRLHWNCDRLKSISEKDLTHTAYYRFVLKSVLMNMMTSSKQSTKEWEKDVKCIEDNPMILIDLLTGVKEWQQKTWEDFPGGDLTLFMIRDPEDQSTT